MHARLTLESDGDGIDTASHGARAQADGKVRSDVGIFTKGNALETSGQGCVR